MFTPAYLCLPQFSHVYLCLELFTRACFDMLPTITHVYLYRFTLCLPLFSRVFLCLLVFAYM